MGYEITLIVGKPSLHHEATDPGDGSKYTSVTFFAEAVIDLCKAGDSHICRAFTKGTPARRYFHTWQAQATSIGERWFDAYGDQWEPITVKAAIDALRQDVQESDYHRFKWALALLESIDTHKESRTTHVMLYGH